MIPKPCFADCDAVVRKDLAAHVNVNSYSLDGSINRSGLQLHCLEIFFRLVPERFVTLTVFTCLSNNCKIISDCQRTTTKKSRLLLYKQLLKIPSKDYKPETGVETKHFCFFCSAQENRSR